MIPTEFRNASGERITFCFVPGTPRNRDLVVLGHGLTSDKSRPWSEGLSSALQEAGIASLRIAFSGNGDSEGEFVDSNITKEVSDLGSVIDALEDWRVSYVGHSMGGAVGLLRATGDHRIHALVSLAAVTHTREFIERMFGHLTLGQPMLEKPHCPIGEALRSDLTAIGSTVEHATRVSSPWLIVHGSLDEVVPQGHSIDLHAAVPEHSELVLLDGVDHSFSGAGLDQMLECVAPWLIRTLAKR